jgi:hypothetical protein
MNLLLEPISRSLSKAALKVWKLVYWPFCRAYARISMPSDEQANRFMASLIALQFWIVHRYWPCFKNPRSYSEKIFARMLFDRNPLFTRISDKWLVRDYVAEKIGPDHLIPLLWHGSEPEAIPFETLPHSFVIKANHGCGYNMIVKNKELINRFATVRQLKKWLNQNYCTQSELGIEWAYKNIKPAIIIEQFLNENDKPPMDYKLFCYSGRVEFVLMVFDRHGSPSVKHFNRDFTPLYFSKGRRQYEGNITRPAHYDSMVELAEILAQEFDFIRVDLYYVDGRTYLGELTCYPTGGLARFIPREYDNIFGDKWALRRYLK